MNIITVFKFFAILTLVIFVSSCATGSVRIIGNVSTYKSGSCEVKVYQTKTQAIENGLKKEVCVIEGSSAFSFDHSIEGAIKNNIQKVCQCGVNKAYVESAHTESHMGIKKRFLRKSYWVRMSSLTSQVVQGGRVTQATLTPELEKNPDK